MSWMGLNNTRNNPMHQPHAPTPMHGQKHSTATTTMSCVYPLFFVPKVVRPIVAGRDKRVVGRVEANVVDCIHVVLHTVTLERKVLRLLGILHVLHSHSAFNGPN